MKNQKYIIFILLALVATCLASLPHSQLGYQYLSPRPDATEVSKHATIIIRFAASPAYLSNIQEMIRVHGENGDLYTGQIKIASDNKTVIFTPDSPFVEGEIVHVEIAPRFHQNEGIVNIDYTFTVSQQETNEIIRQKNEPHLSKPVATMGQPTIMPNGVSVPSDFPHVEVTVNDNPADGYIFINNWGDSHYNIMLEPDGSPVWYQRTPDERRDMKVQKNGLVTMLVRQGYSFGQGHIALDNTFTVVDSFFAAQGYSTDEHELQVLENGHYLLFGLRTMTVDMSKILPGGKTNARISETGIQEFTPQGDLIFHWRAWDNFDPVDMIGFSDDLPTNSSFRFPHMNSIDIDDDGHIILSSKRLSEVTKIHRQTGEMIWRLGGANNEFTFIDDPLDGFSMQHSVRVLGNGHYTIFDNGVFHDPQLSRALEYKIDTSNMTATLVWSYQRQKQPIYAFHMGNVQRLPNGNSLINWAVQDMPKAQEVRPDGTTAFEINFVDRFKTYRTFKFQWKGVVQKPVLVVESQADNVTLIFNKFGDDNVDYYNIYAGRGINPTTVVATSKTTIAKLYDLENRRRYFIRVTAVDKDGNESDFSNQEQVVVNSISPGTEMVDNGDFSGGKTSWDWLVRNGAQATWSVEDGTARISITNGGDDDHDIQLTQAGITLVQGREYDFEFDASADNPRTIEAKIAQNGGSFTNYSGLGATALSRSSQRIAYRFRMDETTDSDARIVFNVGASTSDVYIRNVSVKMVEDTQVQNQDQSPDEFKLVGNYPNPFNGQTNIRFAIPEETIVRLDLYNILGQFEKNITNERYESGFHSVRLDASDLSSGVYFSRMTTGSKKYHGVHKLVLMK